MTGRGIDQILPYPSSPEIYEPYMTSAVQYVKIAERSSGPIPRAVDYAYIWGDVLQALEDAAPDARIINLETAVTTSDDYWPGKGINYRMHPANTPCLTAAGIDCCVLANNHVIDWGYQGLRETLHSLQAAGIRIAGAGRDIAEARAPAVIDLGGQCRVSVFSMGSTSSGIGRAWAAGMLVTVGGGLVGGARLALATEFNPKAFWDDVHRYGATVVFYAGEMLRELLRSPPSSSDNQNSIRLFAGSGLRRGAEQFP